MAASNSRSEGISEFQSKNLCGERGEISPERNVVWSEPQNFRIKSRVVAVLYYLSRNGQLEHPHFMEVPLSSPHGLFLKDVMSRLNALRGKGMASMYSWSCKRRYKNGFVWHDLSENDVIYPAHGHDYILKGSELPENAFPDAASPPPQSAAASGDHDRPPRNQSCSSADFECNLSSGKSSAAAATQTEDDRRRHRRGTQPADIAEEDGGDCRELHRVEIEISTPPSDSSPETLGTLMRAETAAGASSGHRHHHHHHIQTAAGASSGHRHHHIQRCQSSVLMQLISCGSMPFKDCGAGGDGGGQGMIGGRHKMRAPRGGGIAETGGGKLEEEKEYFSGSLVLETKKREFPALKRSSSYNADRRLNLEVAEKEIERLKAKCIPTKTKAQSSTRKEGSVVQN